MRIHIYLNGDRSPLGEFTASELSKYLSLLFEAEAEISAGTAAGAGHSIVMSRGPLDDISRYITGGELGDQQFLLKNTGNDAIVLRGGSRIALLWAVYELASQWGVTYTLKEDVLPAPGPSNPFVEIDRTFTPRLEIRSWRVFGDFPLSGEAWSLKQQLAVLGQAVKLKFNSLWFGMAPMHAFIDVEIDGIRRSTAKFFYGIPVPVTEENIGFERLYKTDSYVGPDFRGCTDFRATHEVMKNYAATIIDRAKFFEMTVTLPIDVFTYCPEFAPALENAQVNHQIGDPFVYEGGDLFGEKSLRMIKAHWDAYLNTYPQADNLILAVPELPRNTDAFGSVWESLCRRLPHVRDYDIESLISGEAAGNYLAGGRKRSADEARTTLVLMETMYRLFDHFDWINELKRAGKHLGWNAGLTCPQLMPLIADLMWDDGIFVAIFGYTASRSVRAVRFLEGVRNGRVTVCQYLTLEDDNTGYLPQMCDTPAADLVEAGIDYGVTGFFPRFYPIADLDPTFNMLAEISWHEDMTAQKSFIKFVSRLYGPQTVRPLLRAMNLMEMLTAFLDIRIGLLFPDDKNISRKIGPKTRILGRPDDMLYHVQAMYKEVLNILEGVSSGLTSSVSHRHMAYRISRIRFAVLVFDWLEMLDGVNEAIDAADVPAARQKYVAARRKMCEALQTVADNIGDDSDLGALAYYYNEFIRNADARFESVVVRLG